MLITTGTESRLHPRCRRVCFRPALAVWQRFPYNFRTTAVKRNEKPAQVLDLIGAPNRIRTGVLALRGLCPGPLDDGSEECGVSCSARYYRELSRLLKPKDFN